VSPKDYLYVVVPGIGGSVLEFWQGDRREVLWEGLGQVPGAVLRPSRLGIGDDDGVVATGLINDWRMFPGFTVVDGYSSLVHSVAGFAETDVIDWGDPAAVNLGARVVCFPFDFRRSVAEAATGLSDTLGKRLTRLGQGEGVARKRVVIVAHSMGGLVARYWAGPLGGAGVCKAMVTLGTPHRGAPKALEVMANGLRFGPVPVPGKLSSMLRTWPGFHELLPRYESATDGDLWFRPKDLELENLDQRRASAAFEVHEDIQTAWEDLGSAAPALTPVIGVGQRTLETSTVKSPTKVSTNRVLPSWIAAEDEALATFLGDGTVPRISAIPIELDEDRFRPSQRLVVGAKHGKLVNWEGVAGELRLALTGSSTGAVRGDGSRSCVADLPDAWPVGHPVPGTIRVYEPTNGGSLQVSEAVTSVQVRGHGPDPDRWFDATPSGEEWLVELPPQYTAGLVRMEVRATTVDGDDPDYDISTIRLIDDQVLEDVDDAE